MARIALIDPTGRAATTVEAVLGGSHELVVRPRVHAPGDVELVIADLSYADLVDPSTLRGLTSFGPVLVLLDRKDPVPPAVEESNNLSILRKPFDAFELRLKVDQLLRSVAPPATRAALPRREDEENGWLEFPFVSAPAGAVLRQAAKLSTPLWLLGEPGSGRRRIAAAVCRAATPPLRMVTLFPDERLQAVLEREQGADPFALLVPEIEERPLIEQERMAAILAGKRCFRLIATSADDPAERVVAGTFSRNLYRHLSALAVQLSPLREQPIAIPPLAQTLARRIARRLGSDGELSFSGEAMQRLQGYMWPGNVVELEAVLTRTLACIGDGALDGRTIEAHELLFTAGDLGRGRAATRGAGQRTSEAAKQASRRETRDDKGAAEAKEPREPAAAAVIEVVPAAIASPASTEQGEPTEPSFENIVVGLAHDLRNPMTTIKTFASTLASGALDPESSRELGQRVGDECDRLNGCLEELQRYSSFGAPTRESTDFLALVRQSVGDLGEEQSSRVQVDAEGEAVVDGDPSQLRFVADNVIAAALAELPRSRSLRIEKDGGAAVVFKVPGGQGPVTKLRRLVGPGEPGLSWRILLARAVAARNGCRVDVRIAGEAMTIRLVLRGREEGNSGQQTSRINR